MSTELRWVFNSMSWEPTKRQLLKALSCISLEENTRIRKFRFKDDYKHSLIGRLLIRKCVNKLLDLNWCDIHLSRDEKGKPILISKHAEKALYFNISHQGSYTVLAASCKSNVGIDVMKFVSPNNIDTQSFFQLMKRQFVTEEWDYIRSFSQQFQQLKAFYRLWCLKESYLKAIGTGIGTSSAAFMKFDIKTSDLTTSPCCDTHLYLDNCQQTWKFTELLLDELHVVTVASEHDVSKEFEYLVIDDLLLADDANHAISANEKCWDEFEIKDYKK